MTDDDGDQPTPQPPCGRPSILDTMRRLEHARLTGTPYEPWTPPPGDPALCRIAFDMAFVAGTETRFPTHGPIVINQILIDVFGAAEVLDHIDFSEAHGPVSMTHVFRVGRGPMTKPDPEAYRAAGTRAGEATSLGIIAEEPDGGDGRRRFRLLDRQPAFALVKRKAIRVLNLPPAERAARDRRERATARLRETLDRKARDAATPIIGRLLNAIVRRNRAYAIPRAWFDGGFVPETVVGRSLAASFPFVVERHHGGGFDRARLAAWQDVLIGHVRSLQAAQSRSPIAPPLEFKFEFPEDVESIAHLASSN